MFVSNWTYAKSRLLVYHFVADFIGGTHLHLSKLRSSKSRRRVLQLKYNFSRKSSQNENLQVTQ
jgi:hypothetical protein